MTQKLKPGSRWVSAVDSTEVIIVKGVDADDLTLECGGHEMLVPGAAKPPGLEIDPTLSTGVAVGKRFEHERGIEVLCTKGGTGSLTLNGSPLVAKGAKLLPSSD